MTSEHDDGCKGNAPSPVGLATADQQTESLTRAEPNEVTELVERLRAWLADHGQKISPCRLLLRQAAAALTSQAEEIERLRAREQSNRPGVLPSEASGEDGAATRIADELQRTFDLQWKADQRAIKRWQAAHPGSDLVWPDRADMVVWLMEQHDAMLAVHAACVTFVAADDALLEQLRAEGRHVDLTGNPWPLVDAMRAALSLVCVSSNPPDSASEGSTCLAGQEQRSELNPSDPAPPPVGLGEP
jgi:hypothetical protein